MNEFAQNKENQISIIKSIIERMIASRDTSQNKILPVRSLASNNLFVQNNQNKQLYKHEKTIT